MKGMIFDIEHGSFVDGPGIRTTVFFKGCNLDCKWCHNPESKSMKMQMMFYKDKCRGCGKCKEICPNDLKKCGLCGKCELYCPVNARKITGREISAEELFKDIAGDKPFYESSEGGVTFSGGECMLQIDFLCEMLEKCKQNGIHTAVDTAGNLPFEYFEKILPFTDLFLYDVKSMNTDIHKQYTGVGNELILENLKKLLALKKRVWVRVPVIKGINDGKQDALKIAEFYKTYGYPEKTELLPYHKMGENKYEALGKTPDRFSPPDGGTLAALKELL